MGPPIHPARRGGLADAKGDEDEYRAPDVFFEKTLWPPYEPPAGQNPSPHASAASSRAGLTHLAPSR